MQYRKIIADKAGGSLRRTNDRIVLFVGAGLTRRYLNLPNWRGLLEEILKLIGGSMPLDYFLQKTDKTYLDDDLLEVAEDIAELVHSWAWSSAGKQNFPEAYYDPSISHTVFFKHLVAETLKKNVIHNSLYSNEINALKKINTNLIVTTNYDYFLEELFRLPVDVGRRISSGYSSKKILKVHGSQEQPESIIILPSDYHEFSLNHKYIFSKLLVHFIEDTCLFLGYSLSDAHIQNLLFDACEATQQQKMENVFLLDYNDEPKTNATHETSFNLNKDHRSASINIIRTTEFEWVYRLFSTD